MSGSLPALIDPVRLADEGVRLQGELELSVLPRLATATVGDPADAGQQKVAVDLQFERTAQGARVMRGTVSTRVNVVCQRCLRPMPLALRASPLLVVLGGDESAGTGDDAADCLVAAGPISLAELVEDELLLAMPMVPVHDENDCKALIPGAASPAEPGTKGASPFAALDKLKRRKQ